MIFKEGMILTGVHILDISITAINFNVVNFLEFVTNINENLFSLKARQNIHIPIQP